MKILVMGRQFVLAMIALVVATDLPATEIEVRGLFGGAAVLDIDGRQQLLKQDQVSVEGVKLIDANSERAVVLVDGETREVYLSEHISSSFTAASQNQVHITINENRQYMTPGSINGRPVRYLIDTGANVIAINSAMARSLGISLQDGVETHVSTASASHRATRINIREVQVGAIKLEHVPAVVIEGDHPREILLGMSFLEHVNISENNGLMVLTSKL